MVRLQRDLKQRASTPQKNVSIPLWFDYNSLIDFRALGVILFSLNSTMVRLQPINWLSGEYPQPPGLNSTMVRLQLRPPGVIFSKKC